MCFIQGIDLWVRSDISIYGTTCSHYQYLSQYLNE